MSAETLDETDPRIQRALAELRGLIAARYPSATFTVSGGDDPPGVYLTAVVDIDDVDEVADVFLDRLVALQVDDGLPVYVIPIEPLERTLETMRARDLGQPIALP